MLIFVITGGEKMDIFKEVIIDGIEALILLSIFGIFFDEKKFIKENKIKSIVFCFLFTTFLFWSSTYVTIVYHTLFNVAFSILLLTFVTKIKIISSMVVYFIFTTIILVTEISVGMLEMLFFHTDLQQIVLNPNYLLLFTIITKMLQIIIVALLFRFNLSIRRFKLFRKEEGELYSNFIIAIGVFGIFTFGVSFSVYDMKNIATYNILIFTLYIAFFIVAIRDLKEREKLINIKNKYKIQEYEIKNMEQIISIIRQEKHDYANHINVIQALCCLNKPNAVERIKSYVSKISETIHSSFRYLDTGNDYIDGLLSIKNNYAIKNEIDFRVIINESFSTLKIREDELISIVSNLVDNAFESFEKNLTLENKKVSFETILENEKFIIRIIDNGILIPESILKNIFIKGFSTKIEKKEGHGFGLFISKELVEKNHGIISVESNIVESNIIETIFSVMFDLKKVKS